MTARILALFLIVASVVHAETPLESALSLYRAKQYPAAAEALEKIVAADPRNAAAHYYLGMTVSRRADDKALPQAVALLEKATALAPENATYLADYAGLSLLLAQKNRSLTTALRGRDAMEKAIKMDPANLDAREGLFRFYNEAPWPLASRAKAKAQLDEIAKRDPERGQRLGKSLK